MGRRRTILQAKKASLRLARRERSKRDLFVADSHSLLTTLMNAMRRAGPRLNYLFFSHCACDLFGLYAMAASVAAVVVVGGLTLYYGARAMLGDEDDPFAGRSVVEAMYVTLTMVLEGGRQEAEMSEMELGATTMSWPDLYTLRAIVALVSLCGVVAVHATVAFVLNQVTELGNRYELGPQKLALENHFVIINLTERAFETINQLVLSLEYQEGTIVVLDPRRRSVLEELIEARVRVPPHRRYCRRIRSGWDPASRIEVLCRQGNSHAVHDLDSVSASAARVVIVFAAPQSPHVPALRRAGALAKLQQQLDEGGGGGGVAERAAAAAAAVRTLSVSAPRDSSDADAQIWCDNPDARTVGTILSLVSGHVPMRGHIVAEAVDSHSRPVMDLIGGAYIETVETRHIIRHLFVQSALMPGISFVYDELLSFKGAEFYYKSFGNALAGAAFGNVLSMFDSAVPIGVEEAATGVLHINPSDEYRICAADKLAFVAAEYASVRLSPTLTPAWSLERPFGEADDEDDEAPRAARKDARHSLQVLIGTLKRQHDAKPKLRILICGWRDDLGGMISALDEKVAPGSELQIFCTLKAEQRNSIFRLGHLPDTRNLTVHHFVGHPEVRREMEQLGGVQNYDRVIVMADESSNTTSGSSQVMMSDSNAVSTLLLARNEVNASEAEAEACGEDAPPPTTIMCELLDARTSDMVGANAAIASETLFLSNLVTANVLAMVAGSRKRHNLLRALLGSNGAELRIRPCQSVVRDHESVCFWECARRVRRFAGEVLIGYIARAPERTEEVREVRAGQGGPTAAVVFELSAGIALNPPHKGEAVDLDANQLDFIVLTGGGERTDDDNTDDSADSATAAAAADDGKTVVAAAVSLSQDARHRSPVLRRKTSTHGAVRPASTEYSELWRECQDVRRGVSQLRSLVATRGADRRAKKKEAAAAAAK